MDKIPSSKSSATRVVAIQALFLGVVCDSPLIARDSHNIPDLGGLPYDKYGDARSGGKGISHNGLYGEALSRFRYMKRAEILPAKV